MNASRRWALGALVIIAAAGIAGFAYVRAMTPKLTLGVGYAARVGCGCRFIGNRPLASCYHDFEPGMEPIRLSENVAEKSVTAYVPLIASRTAKLDPVLGCQPEPLRQ